MLIMQNLLYTRNTHFVLVLHTYLSTIFYIKIAKYHRRVQIFNETNIDIYSKLNCAVIFEGIKQRKGQNLSSIITSAFCLLTICHSLSFVFSSGMFCFHV